MEESKGEDLDPKVYIRVGDKTFVTTISMLFGSNWYSTTMDPDAPSGTPSEKAPLGSSSKTDVSPFCKQCNMDTFPCSVCSGRLCRICVYTCPYCKKMYCPDTPQGKGCSNKIICAGIGRHECCGACVVICHDEGGDPEGCGKKFCPRCMNGCRGNRDLCYYCQNF